MKKTVRITAAALICLLCAALLQPILPAARAADAFPAQRVEAEDIRPGDRIVIVGGTAGTAVSVRPAYSRLTGAAVTVG